MKTDNPLRLALEDVLGPAGYTRKGDSWFRRTEDVVEVVNLQTSQWGPQHYLNYGLWLRALGDVPFPRVEKCHIGMRAEDFVSSAEPLNRIMDLESDATDSERRTTLALLLTSEFLPFASTCRTAKGLRLLLEAGKLDNVKIFKDARFILGESAP